MPRTETIIYKEQNGKVPLLEWMDTLPHKVVDKWTKRFDLLKQFGFELRRPICDYLRDEIYELRLKTGKLNYRVLYSYVGQNVVLLSHGCSKEKKVPEGEINREIEHRENYSGNPQAHTYIED